MLNKALIETAIEAVKERFFGDYTGHDYSHTMRVYEVASAIAAQETADMEIVQLASLLHDVDDYKLFGGAMGGFSYAQSFLRNQQVEEQRIEDICKIISEISFKGSDTIKPGTIEGMIVQDADRLDAIGAVGIARAFSYGAVHQRKMYDKEEKPKLHMNAEEYRKNKGNTINHFYEKLLLLKDMMNTETGKQMALQRHQFMEGFLGEFWDEVEGKR